VARRLGISKEAVSQVLNGKYGASLSRIEQRVKGALLGETVDCPILGDIKRNVCLDWQAKPFAATNELRVMLYRACRDGCPHSKLQKLETDE
jgi:transcriptional regulator with XRE-family HTH domain